MASPSYASLAVGDRDTFEAAFRIYAESIPLRERKPRAELAAMLRRTDYAFRVAQLAGEVVGVAVLFLPTDGPPALLEYVAVAAAHRGQGIGGGLFADCARRAAAGPGGARPMLLEVESDREPSPEREVRRRRLAFYRRLGCRRVEGCRYQLPIPGAGAPPAMDLLAYSAPAAGAVPRAVVRRWLEVLYTRVYGCRGDDPRIDEMLAPLPDPVRLS